MKKKPLWILGLIGIVVVIAVPLLIFLPRSAGTAADPKANLPSHPVHVDHSDIISGTFTSGQEVTRLCLTCHAEASKDMMKTTHWTWESQAFSVPWRDEAVTIGKANQINNFCIGIQGNQKKCTTCHAGYGWNETGFDFANQENVDCLVCHADKGTYGKGEYGNPAKDLDLLAAARSVRAPTRDNCGTCHFNGGGGNNVKHGDLSEALYFPSDQLDVHMGGQNMLCTDCHRTDDHAIKGRLLADNYTINAAEQVACTDCHLATPHNDERVNLHAKSVACQTCHIPTIATKDPTKTTWDWSTAGQDLGDNHFEYLKIKGSFQYESDLAPEYLWFNGNNEYRYILGDPIDPSQPTLINKPAGSISDPTAKIFPFKLHIANQPYDATYNYLLQPITAGKDGYWTNFDWDQAFRLAEPVIGLKYSGNYSFTTTYMYWPTTHLTQPAANALQCNDCHGESGRMDWTALGYPGDPIKWGSRFSKK